MTALFELRGAPAQPRGRPARAGADGRGGRASRGERNRAGRQAVHVHPGDLRAHRPVRRGALPHDVVADGRHRRRMARRAGLDGPQGVLRDVEFAAAPNEPGHLAQPAPKRASLPRVDRTRDGRHQLADPPAGHSRLVDALDVADQGQRPLGEQGAHGPPGESARMGERPHVFPIVSAAGLGMQRTTRHGPVQ